MDLTPRYTTDQWDRERWVRGSRYYDMCVHQDLWGHWVATRVNGQIKSILGRVVHEPALSRADAQTIVSAWRRRRLQRGYQLNVQTNTVKENRR